MTKIYFESDPLESKVIKKIEDTVSSLQIIESYGYSIRIPRGYKSSKYSDTMKTLSKTKKGLQNIKKDLVRAIANYETAEIKCKRNNKNFDSNYKVFLDEPIIKIN